MTASRPLAGPGAAATVARFPGTCAACREPIRRGEALAKHEGSWLHERCAAERERIARVIAQEQGADHG